MPASGASSPAVSLTALAAHSRNTGSARPCDAPARSALGPRQRCLFLGCHGEVQQSESGLREEPLDRFHQSASCQIAIRAEEVGPLDRGERPAGAQLKVRDVAVVEADRYQPWVIRLPTAQLVDGQQEFFVLVALLPCRTVTGEASLVATFRRCCMTRTSFCPTKPTGLS